MARLTREQLADLVEFVDALVAEEGCDHKFRHTRRWADEHRRAWNPIASALEDLGAFCDCEVVMNCGPEGVHG
jgi:Protein of unknown function (DUF2695)